MARILLMTVGVLVALILAAVMIVPMMYPPERLEAEIESQATNALGRPVTIEGAPKISVFPTKVSVSQLMVANAEGFNAPHLLKVESADIGLKLFPLLSGNVELTQFDLNAPDIRLEAKPNGTNNWTLGSGSAPSEERAQGGKPINDIRLGDVIVNNGQVSYENGQGTTYQASNANLVMTLTSLDDPLTLKGEMILQNEPSTVDFTMSTPRRFAEQGEADMNLAMMVGQNKADTRLSLDKKLTFNGNLDVDAPALRSLMALVGTEIATPNGFQRMRLKGDVSGSTDRLAFAQGTELTFDEISGTGAVTIDLSGARPSISGNMAVGKLDVTPYLPEENAEMKAVKAGDATGFPEWSTDRMDLSALGAVDADLKISAESIILPSLQIGRSAVDLKIANQNMVANVTEMALYGGQGKGFVRANVRGAEPVIDADLNLTGVDVGSFAQELVGLSKLIGKGNVDIDVSTRGLSQADFVRQLTGTVNTTVEDGMLKGINLGKIARGAMDTYETLRTGKINPTKVAGLFTDLTTQARGPAEETDFNDLLVGLNMTNGVISSEILRLSGPYYDITGSASVNLPQQSMRMTLTPSVDTGEEGIRQRLPIPILISGTFNAPKVGLDSAPLIREFTTGQVKNLLGVDNKNVVPGESVEDVLRNKAQDELNKLIRPEQKEQPLEEEASEGQTDAQAEEKSLEETLVEEGLKSIFGGKKDD